MPMNIARCTAVCFCLVATGVAGFPPPVPASQPEPANSAATQTRPSSAQGIARAQVPRWSDDDMQFFLHGSMSAEFVPERVLKAFLKTYPDLFPSGDLATFGLITESKAGLPIGFSRRVVVHLGGLPSVGINCAACHVAELKTTDAESVQVLGAPSHFNVEAFFAAVMSATFRTAEPENMRRFLGHYLRAGEPSPGPDAQALLTAELERQKEHMAAAISADPFASLGIAPGTLHALSPDDLRLDRKSLEPHQDLVPLVQSLLRLFHNMRTALHVPDQPPQEAPPASGPGRNNAFGLLSQALFGVPTLYAPVKYGLVWNLERRTWVHWDGNTRAPLIRNLAAALGLGAPLLGKRGQLDFALVDRHTRLSEQIAAPRYPFAIDASLAERGARPYQARCASCHDVAGGHERLYALDEIKTDPNRATLFDARQANLFNDFFAKLEIPGYAPPQEPAIRSTQKYWAPDLAGVWARSPYLHNGSVRTMWDLLVPAGSRPKSFRRGTRAYDAKRMGYADEGAYRLDTSAEGNSNAGHEYGTDLTEQEKRELIEYLKTR